MFYRAVDARNRTGEPAKWKDLKRAHISVTFILPNKRRRDMDNLIAANKAGIDALVGCGILRDDDLYHVSFDYHATFGDNAMTVLEISEGK